MATVVTVAIIIADAVKAIFKVIIFVCNNSRSSNKKSNIWDYQLSDNSSTNNSI